MPEIVSKEKNISDVPRGVHTRSDFSKEFSNHVAGTYRFGEYSPHFCFESVNGDNSSFLSKHNLRSYTLKTPLMSDLKLHKDYFLVPNEAILPFNWDKVYTNPVLGDDVIAQDVNCILSNAALASALASNYEAWKEMTDEDGEFTDIDKVWEMLLKALVAIESVFSSGSLLATLGCNLSSKAFFEDKGEPNEVYLVDAFFDHVFSMFVRASVGDTSSPYVTFGKGVDAKSFFLVPEIDKTESFYLYKYITFRDFLMRIRDDHDWTLHDCAYGPDIELTLFKFNANYFAGTKPINLSRVLAYQIVCAHFYTNDKIDYVYSAELFRQLFRSLLGDSLMTDAGLTFTYNGLSVPYDYFSGHFINAFINYWTIDLEDEDFIGDPYGEGIVCLDSICDFCSLIFSFKRSLRFVDYFTGSKSRPLAVGDTSVPVTAGEVDVVDVTKNIQVQRFLNFVNRTGRRFEEYVQSLGGVSVKPDYHNPLFLSGVSDVVIDVENENTGDAQFTKQNSVSSVLRSNSARYAFELTTDRPCIVIGITYFDIPRYYFNNIERQNFHVDRYDMFNEFMQFIGDQPIYSDEIGFGSDTFGYTQRHNEYKHRVNTCFGGFVNSSLPGWLFLADKSNFEEGSHIGPDYIRSRSSELDSFYVSLTGWSLGTYFHFIIDNHNVFNRLSRPMASNPQIL